tara:strand:- start:1158 stop:1502 length:345 start_codon:yes stop_codon:yes gene_type:complete
MAFTQEEVLGSALTGFNTELVTLSTEASQAFSSIIDSSNNIYVRDEKKLYFGTDSDFNMSLGNGKDTILFNDKDDNSVFGVNKDGSLLLSTTSGTIESTIGNLTYRNDGLYIYL